jgi:pilus assembly protein Flp/PilA
MERVLKMIVAMQLGVAGLVEKAREERGATAVEYGLLVALIAAVIVVVVATLGTKIEAAFQTVVDALP